MLLKDKKSTKTTKKITPVMDMQQEIIHAAGQIYNYLAENGEVSLTKMKKDLDLNGNFAEMGLGWLSREDKIMYSQKSRTVSISLR